MEMDSDPKQREFEAVVGNLLSKLQRPLSGLEMFSRDGSWSSAAVLGFCDEIQCWEINPKYIPDLKKNIPRAEVHEVDSVAYARVCEDRFDFISLDAPQGTFGPYCEHFEALPSALGLLKDRAVIAFVANIFPHHSRASDPPKDNYGKLDHSEWSARRNQFYGRDATKFDFDFLQTFYTSFFAAHGFRASNVQSFALRSKVPNHPDFLVRCCAQLVRT